MQFQMYLSDDEGLQHLHLEGEVLYSVAQDVWERLFEQRHDDVMLRHRTVVQPALQQHNMESAVSARHGRHQFYHNNKINNSHTALFSGLHKLSAGHGRHQFRHNNKIVSYYIYYSAILWSTQTLLHTNMSKASISLE